MTAASFNTDQGSAMSHEQTVRIMRRLKVIARLMDNAWAIPFTNFRVGLDPLIGLLPVGGDAAGLAITLYIARRYGGTLGPQSDAETALMEQWALFAATAIEDSALNILMTQTNGGNTPEAQSHIAICAEKLRRPLARLQKQLEGSEWLMGQRFTVADLNTAECVRYAQGHPSLLDEFPAVKEWLARCQARPAFQAMWAKRNAEPA